MIGNPPWVTNSELSSLGSSNLPEKVNLKNLSGLDAMTGSSNFDIAEYIWLKLIKELSNEKATIALLCKTSVARNVLQFVVSKKISISNAAIIKIDAKKWFGVAVDACLFYLDVGSGTPDYEVPVYENLETLVPASTIGFINGQLVSDVKRLDSLNRLDGVSQLNWRQGLKHDAASVIELKIDDLGEYRNKLGQVVEVEKDYIFPFLKSSDLAGKSKVKPQRAVLVPQRRLGEDTSTLVYKAPLLWAYLNQHRNEFEQRKSSIYRNQPPFAFFGLGDYSFASYKVAISGMYKEPVFRLVVSQDKRPVMLDDTCYFLACSSGPQALLITSLLNNPICLDFLHSIAFWDAKRPITKKILQRIDLCALLRYQNISEIIQRIYIELDQLQNILSIEERTQYLTLLQNMTLSDMENLVTGRDATEAITFPVNYQTSLPGFTNV